MAGVTPGGLVARGDGRRWTGAAAAGRRRPPVHRLARVVRRHSCAASLDALATLGVDHIGAHDVARSSRCRDGLDLGRRHDRQRRNRDRPDCKTSLPPASRWPTAARIPACSTPRTTRTASRPSYARTPTDETLQGIRDREALNEGHYEKQEASRITTIGSRSFHLSSAFMRLARCRAES